MLPRHHRLIRFLALAITVVAVTYMAGRHGARTDVTSEGLSRLTPSTTDLIASIGEDTPVQVHAFVSDDVPRGYVTVRSRLLNILREMEARGGPGLRVRIVSPKEYSEQADEAMQRYGIPMRALEDRSKGRSEVRKVFLGLAFVSGPREEVVPFLSRGLSVEYEVARALRMVMQEKKKVVGILRTDVTVMGNFDLQSRTQQPAWAIVEELKKQYEVRSLNPGAEVPEDVDVLLVPQLPSLTQAELDKVKAYVDAGRAALLTVDPFPAFNIRMAPREEKPPPPGQGGGGPFGGGGGAPSQPKGDYVGFLRQTGVSWQDDRVLYDSENMHPNLAYIAPQVIFVAERRDGTKPFAVEDTAVNGLEEVVVIYGGEVGKDPDFTGQYTPLLTTGRQAGYSLYEDMVERHPLFGPGPKQGEPKKSAPTGTNHAIAARLTGGGDGGDIKDRNVVVIADLDIIGDQFFALRQQGGDIDGDGLVDVRFDNVAFVLNVIDSLAGDDRFVELRKRKPAFRRLTQIEEETDQSKRDKEAARSAADTRAENEIKAAQEALDAKIKAIEQGGGDETTRATQVRAAKIAEDRRLKVKEQEIAEEAQKEKDRIEAQYQRKVDEVQNRYRLIAVLVPPLPALLLGVFIFWRKRRREQDAIPVSRSAAARAGGAAAGRAFTASAGTKKKKEKPKAEPDDDPDDAADDDDQDSDDDETSASDKENSD